MSMVPKLLYDYNLWTVEGPAFYCLHMQEVLGSKSSISQKLEQVPSFTPDSGTTLTQPF